MRSWFSLFVLILVGFASSQTDKTLASSRKSSATGVPEATNANYTTAVPASPPPRGSCTTENWSNGSAFLLLATLALGCLAHPKGSLVFPFSGRAWRLSPLFLLAESCCILSRLFSGWWRGFSLRVVCHTLLGLRIGNSWAQYQFDEFFREPFEPDVDVEHGFDGEDDDDSKGVAVRVTGIDRTVPPVELESEHTPARTTISRIVTQTEWFQLSGFSRASKKLREKKLLLLLDRCFVRHLLEVRTYQHGPIYRLIIWIPMLQQAIKLGFVSGAPFTRAIGFVFFASWLLVEWLLVRAATGPLDACETKLALKLARHWKYRSRNWVASSYPSRPEFFVKLMKILERRDDDWPAETDYLFPNGDAFGVILLALLSNTLLFQCVVWGKASLGTLYEESNPLKVGNWLKLPFFLLTPWGLLNFCLWCIIVCPATLLSELFVIGFLHWSRLSRLAAPPDGRSIDLERPEDQLATLTAVQLAVIGLVAYTGFIDNNGLKYDCLSTHQPSFYDWLG